VVAVSDWTYGNGTGNSGLTISKLISAKVALDAAEGEEDEERYIAIKSTQLGNLLATTEATSQDYNTVKALVNGQIDTFMGFKFLHSERLQLNGSSQTRVPAWRKSAMGLGLAKDIDGQLSQRADKSYAWYPISTRRSAPPGWRKPSSSKSFARKRHAGGGTPRLRGAAAGDRPSVGSPRIFL
jgi:hypothetical protein